MFCIYYFEWQFKPLSERREMTGHEGKMSNKELRIKLDMWQFMNSV